MRIKCSKTYLSDFFIFLRFINFVTWSGCSKIQDIFWKTSTAWKVPRYWVFSGLYFLAFGLKTEIFGVNLHIQFQYGRYGPEKTQWKSSDHSWGNFSFFLSYVFPWSDRYFFSFSVWHAQLTAFQGNFVQYYLKVGIWWKMCIMLHFYFLMCFTSLASWYVETWLSPSKKDY